MSRSRSIPLAGPSSGSSSLLRLALRLDALVAGANGLAYLAAAGILDGFLGLPAGELRAVGAFLVVFAGLVWWVASRPGPAAVSAVVAANLTWALGSVVVAATGAFSPTAVGTVWILLQAVTVGGFAILQAAALRRSG